MPWATSWAKHIRPGAGNKINDIDVSVAYKRKGAEMFGMGVNEITTLGIGIGLIFIGFLGLLMPLFVYRISINVVRMRETIDAMHGMIANHIEVKRENN